MAMVTNPNPSQEIEVVAPAHAHTYFGSYEAYVKDTVRAMVEKSNLPVAGTILIKADIVTRAALRKMEHKGILIGCDVVTPKGQFMRAYYTEDRVPAEIIRVKDQAFINQELARTKQAREG